MATYPKWSTPNRQAVLVKLFLDSRGFCIFGHTNCPIPEHHYSVFIEGLIGDWKAEDREQASLDWKEQQKAIHSLGERKFPIRGQFSAISRDIWHESQPIYYLEALGISGLTLQPYAKVKKASSYFHLYIDLGDSLRGASKNQRRKAIRYGKELPKSITERITEKVRLAVRDYLNH